MQQLHNLEVWMQRWWGWLLLFLLLMMLLLMLLLDQLLLLVGNNADINVINIVDVVFRLELHTADRADLDDVVLDVANEQLHGFTGTERLVANGTQAIHRDAGCIFEPAAAQILPYFSVLKHGVRVSQVKPSNCFQLHPTSMISKHRNIYRENLFTKVLQAPRKSSFTFHFWRKSFILGDVKAAELSNSSFEWKNVTFWGLKHALTPLTYFRGQDPKPAQDLHPANTRHSPSLGILKCFLLWKTHGTALTRSNLQKIRLVKQKPTEEEITARNEMNVSHWDQDRLGHDQKLFVRGRKTDQGLPKLSIPECLLLHSMVKWRFLWSNELYSLSLSLRFNGHFPGEPGLAGVYWSKGWRRWWLQLDYWSCKSCKAPVKPPSTNQHPVFLQAGWPSCPQPTVSKHWRENITFHGLAYPKLIWGSSNFCLWPLVASGYVGKVCHASHQPSDASSPEAMILHCTALLSPRLHIVLL